MRKLMDVSRWPIWDARAICLKDVARDLYWAFCEEARS